VLFYLGVPIVSAVACTGTIGGGPPGGAPEEAPDKPKPRPGGPEAQPGAGALSDEDSVPAAAPVRRMTRLEYDNTLRDLLGITTSVSRALDFTQDNESGTSGFVRGGAITGGDDARLMMAAGASVGEQIGDRLGTLLPCSPVPSGAQEQDDCVTRFIERFGKRAYRRPLTARETELMQRLYRTQRGSEVGASFEQAVGALVGAIIQSPQFLYHWELGSGTPIKDGKLIRYNSYEIASRLSYLFWATMPDEKLFEAADADALGTPEQIAQQARRMLADERAKDGLAEFHTQWAEFGDVTKIPKDGSFEDFTPAAAQAMLKETRDFVASVFQGKGPASLEALLTSSTTVIDPSLAKIYGATAAGTGVQTVSLDPKQRAGLFTQLAFLTAKADETDSHPVKRGDALLKRALCVELKVPTDVTVPPVEEAVPGGATTRQRFEQHSMDPCASCHVMIDPLGFAFESYDTIGAWRTTDQGKPVETRGKTAIGDDRLEFENAVELMSQLARLPRVQECMTTQWMRYMLGRREVDGEAPSVKVAREEFKKANFDLRELLVALTRTRSFTHRLPSPGEVVQ
jgi:hypothetical protein